jgi:hypothetical protein
VTVKKHFCKANFMPDKDTPGDPVQHQQALRCRQRSPSKTVSQAKIRDDMTTIAAPYYVGFDHREASSGQI